MRNAGDVVVIPEEVLGNALWPKEKEAAMFGREERLAENRMRSGVHVPNHRLKFGEVGYLALNIACIATLDDRTGEFLNLEIITQKEHRRQRAHMFRYARFEVCHIVAAGEGEPAIIDRAARLEIRQECKLLVHWHEMR